jgi:hypothetical protein
MAEQIHFISDMGKLSELKYKKRPIIAEFYTEYEIVHLDGVPPANRLVSSSRKN